MVEGALPQIFSIVSAEFIYLSKFFFHEFGSDVTQAFSRNRTSLSFTHTRREDNVIFFCKHQRESKMTEDKYFKNRFIMFPVKTFAVIKDK